MQFPSISVLKFRWELVAAGRHTAKPAQKPCSQSGSIGRLCSRERGQHPNASCNPIGGTLAQWIYDDCKL
ncbi:hypothetical protein CEXT_124461 [Caerostris extrusa]|uniref:Uncharacterized protein n=1 Tax=Caerostris extrusa TaxID=172846 RepID=A0AAV4Q0N6_CAEEX|nr:hypothetical protein CEXT_124461 [Caerostris extrusa]